MLACSRHLLANFSSLCFLLLSSSSLIIWMTSCRLLSTLAASSSRCRRRASRLANHSSRARSSSSGFACATMHAFMASRCCRQTQVAVMVRFTTHSANAVKDESASQPASQFCIQKRPMIITLSGIFCESRRRR